MLIWFNLCIPLIAIIVMAVFFQKKMAWWEYFIIFLIPLAAIAITKVSSVYSQTQDTEYWNAYLTNATYTEEWSTWVHKTCYHTCYDKCKDSDGNESDCNPHDCDPYDCSYCDNNPPYWEAVDNLGNSHGISQAKFEELCRIWGKREFEDLGRSINHHWNCGQDGDAYVTRFDGTFSHLQAYTSKHTYENRVKCSRSVFNFQKVDSADVVNYQLYSHAPINDNYHYNAIYGEKNDSASRQLSRWNAWLGSAKQIHMNILIFKNQPLQAASVQEAYWKRGNKNELILCIGIKDSTITWAKTISWTDVELLKIKLERTVASMSYNLPAIVDTMGRYAEKMWVRKHFSEFKYISVEPTPQATMIAFIVTMILTIGLCIFSILNPFTLKHPGGEWSNRFTYHQW